MYFSGSFGSQSAEEAEYVSSLDDTYRVRSRFRYLEENEPADLLIPLDTHVCRMAYRLGLTDRQTFSLGNARRITGALEEIFPGDPCLGDFALFGYGVSHPDKDEPASDQNFREA